MSIFSTYSSGIVVGLMCLISGNTVLAQHTGPTASSIRYEHQQSPTGRWQIDFFEDPSHFKREVWITRTGTETIRYKLYDHFIPIKAPLVFSPDENLVAVNHGSMAWGTEPAFATITAQGIQPHVLADNEFQTLATRAVEQVGKLPKGAEPAHVYCDAVKCVDNNTAEIRVLLDCQPSPTTRWIGPFFFRYDVSKRSFSDSQLNADERSIRPESPQMAFEGLKSSGSGFLISPKGYLVTNAHVIRGATRIRVNTEQGFLPCTVVAADVSLDLAVLKIETAVRDPFAYLELHDNRQASLGQNVFTIGFPNPTVQGLNPKFTSGQVSSLTGVNDDPHMYQISIPVQPGNSGGPMLTEEGEVSGIVCGALDPIKMAQVSGALPQNVNYAIKSDVLVAFLQKIPECHDLVIAAAPSASGYQQAIQRAEHAAVRVVVSGFTDSAPERTINSNEANHQVEASDGKQTLLSDARKSDGRLNFAYTALRSRLNAAGKAKLRGLQNQWLRERAKEIGSSELLAQGACGKFERAKAFYCAERPANCCLGIGSSLTSAIDQLQCLQFFEFIWSSYASFRMGGLWVILIHFRKWFLLSFSDAIGATLLALRCGDIAGEFCGRGGNCGRLMNNQHSLFEWRINRAKLNSFASHHFFPKVIDCCVATPHILQRMPTIIHPGIR